MTKFKRDIPVGQKVRGYGLLNEYGEFEFIPEQTGARKGQQKIIKTCDDYTLTTTKNCLIVHCRVNRGNSLEVIKHLMKIVSNIIIDVKTYAL